MKRRNDKLKRAAYHEAGHAVVRYMEGLAVRRVSIRPDGDSLGRVTIYKWKSIGRLECDTGSQIRARAEKEIMQLLAGYLAERKYSGARNSLGAHSDVERVYDIANSLTSGPKEVELYVAWLEERTRFKVSFYWPAIKWLARMLIREQEMGAKRVKELIRQGWEAEYQRKLRVHEKKRSHGAKI